MEMTMPRIRQCSMSECAYNKNNHCHALAVTIGGPGPICDTAMRSSTKGGVADDGCVGACKVQNCKYNQSLECSAENIMISQHSDHAECDTFEAM